MSKGVKEKIPTQTLLTCTHALVNLLQEFFMKILANILILFTFFACSSNKTKRQQVEYDQEKNSDGPAWLYDPEEGCDSNEICVSSSADNANLADVRAKKSIAAIFETEIKSNFDVYKTSFSDTELEQVEEEISSEVVESVNGILKTVIIKERFQKGDIHFSLATLDKIKSAKALRAQMDKVREELEFLYEQKQRGAIKRMMILFDKHSRLNDKYIVLTGKKLNLPVSFADIQNIKYLKKSNQKVSIKFNNETPKIIRTHLEQILGEVGYKVIKSSAVDYYISLKWRTKNEYINVKGFEKYSYILDVQASDNLKKQIGTFSLSETATGRNKQDAFLKVKNEILKNIDQKFNLLNLE